MLRVHNKAARISLHNKARIRPHEISGNQRLDEAIAEGVSTSARLHFRPEPSHTACDGARVVCADPEKIWGSRPYGTQADQVVSNMHVQGGCVCDGVRKIGVNMVNVRVNMVNVLRTVRS